MLRESVKSSNIKAVGYDPASRTLQVEFSNGGVFDYNDVAPERHQALLGADSIGRYFHSHIRGTCECRKVDAEPRE